MPRPAGGASPAVQRLTSAWPLESRMLLPGRYGPDAGRGPAPRERRAAIRPACAAARPRNLQVQLILPPPASTVAARCVSPGLGVGARVTGRVGVTAAWHAKHGGCQDSGPRTTQVLGSERTALHSRPSGHRLVPKICYAVLVWNYGRENLTALRAAFNFANSAQLAMTTRLL